MNLSPIPLNMHFKAATKGRFKIKLFENELSYDKEKFAGKKPHTL